jgi:hypothetical protein
MSMHPSIPAPLDPGFEAAGFMDKRGRVTTGDGGNIVLSKAREVLEHEFPEYADRIRMHVPDEKTRRVGQAVAAASLPQFKK